MSKKNAQLFYPLDISSSSVYTLSSFFLLIQVAFYKEVPAI